jgi:hypothetical protein
MEKNVAIENHLICMIEKTGQLIMGIAALSRLENSGIRRNTSAGCSHQHFDMMQQRTCLQPSFAWKPSQEDRHHDKCCHSKRAENK